MFRRKHFIQGEDENLIWLKWCLKQNNRIVTQQKPVYCSIVEITYCNTSHYLSKFYRLWFINHRKKKPCRKTFISSISYCSYHINNIVSVTYCRVQKHSKIEWTRQLSLMTMTYNSTLISNIHLLFLVIHILTEIYKTYFFILFAGSVSNINHDKA